MNLTLILSDERGSTELKLNQIDPETLNESPQLSNLRKIHEHFMPKDEEPEEPAG